MSAASRFPLLPLLVMLVTRGLLWSTGEILLDLLVTAGVAFAATWLVGRIPMTRRNLLFAFLDGAAAMFKPFGGKYQGQTIRLAPPLVIRSTDLDWALEQVHLVIEGEAARAASGQAAAHTLG